MSLRGFGLNELTFLLLSVRWTVLLWLIACLGGGALGVVVAALRVSPSRALRWATDVYITLFQGTPILVQLLLAYYGTSFLGFTPDAWVAASIAFVLNSSAFFGEIWRGCIEAVPRTQWEASDCLGLNRFQQYAYVVLPQAVKLAIPPTVGFMVQIVKNTSLASVIGFVELARAGQIVNNSTFEPFVIFIVVAAIYFAMCYPLSLAARALERKAHVGR
jgi:polar amino acid transport system permease protein